MSVISFPSQRVGGNLLTAAERQNIITTLYRVGITDYEHTVTEDGVSDYMKWTDPRAEVGMSIHKILGEFALYNDRKYSAQQTSRRLQDLLATLV